MKQFELLQVAVQWKRETIQLTVNYNYLFIVHFVVAVQYYAFTETR